MIEEFRVRHTDAWIKTELPANFVSRSNREAKLNQWDLRRCCMCDF